MPEAAKKKTYGTHYLKEHPKFFADLIEGRRLYEIRCDDRCYQVGDVVIVAEYDPSRVASGGRSSEGYTGRQVSGTIVFLTRTQDLRAAGIEALQTGFVVFQVEWLHA